MPTDLNARLFPARLATDTLTAQLFRLFESVYDHVSESRFRADLSEKDWVILLEDSDGIPRGFSTQKLHQLETPAGPVRALYSGDTVITPECWGTQALSKSWFHLAGRLASETETPLHWFLISKGHRTYLYLPLFFRHYHPQAETSEDAGLDDLRNRFAHNRFGDRYDPGSGLIRFPESLGQLKPHLADVPAHRRDDAHTRLFLKLNPDHTRGVELACLALLDAENLKRPARSWFEAGRALGPPPR